MPYCFAEDQEACGSEYFYGCGERMRQTLGVPPSVPHLEWGWALSTTEIPWLLSLGPKQRLLMGLCRPGVASLANSELYRSLLLLLEVGRGSEWGGLHKLA